jgi:hypothetical protein
VNLPMLRMHSAIEKTHVFMEQFKNWTEMIEQLCFYYIY